jgi:hypothetical protein
LLKSDNAKTLLAHGHLKDDATKFFKATHTRHQSMTTDLTHALESMKKIDSSLKSIMSESSTCYNKDFKKCLKDKEEKPCGALASKAAKAFADAVENIEAVLGESMDMSKPSGSLLEKTVTECDKVLATRKLPAKLGARIDDKWLLKQKSSCPDLYHVVGKQFLAKKAAQDKHILRVKQYGSSYTLIGEIRKTMAREVD